jgi:hypothetical protein
MDGVLNYGEQILWLPRVCERVLTFATLLAGQGIATVAVR